MTGGRATTNSNDFTIGYAKARRDLGCRYTIGFYDRKPEEDRAHALRVESVAPGVTVHHAASYSFPSQEVRHRMGLQAAYMVPTMFEGGGMRAEVFTVEPHDSKSWDALVAIDLPVPLSLNPGAAVRREFGAVLTNGSVVARRFGRQVTLQGSSDDDPGAASRRLTFLEPARLSPGRYTLTAVLSDPAGETPFTAHAELTVPEIPKNGPFLVGPMIGRRSGPDVVIHGKEDDKGAPLDHVGGTQSFRPLIVTETDRSQPLFALTEACASKQDAKGGPWRVARGLETSEGGAAGTLDDAIFSIDRRRALGCERYVDAVPVLRLRLGAYTFSAALRANGGRAESAIESRSVTFLLVGAKAPGIVPVAAPQPAP